MVNVESDPFEVFVANLSIEEKAALSGFLDTYVTAERREQMGAILDSRTRHVALFIENIYQSHNTSAVVRSCDGFGFQDLHIVESDNESRINPDVTSGACKWVSMHSYKDSGGMTEKALNRLKTGGYTIAATSLREGCIALEELDLTKKTILCFGTEETGLSDAAHDAADVFVRIPAYGFTQSYNISVSAALCMSSIRRRLEASNVDWKLGKDERRDLYLSWLMKTANRGLALSKRFLANPDSMTGKY